MMQRHPTGGLKRFLQSLNARERKTLSRLDSPNKIQQFLDSLPYSCDDFYRSPKSVLRDRKAHCFDGALFAAAALRRIGHPPRIVYMIAERDDDHLIAPYHHGRRWGSVAKSNTVGLRFREPVYRSLRELVMSYFESYFNIKGEKSLRAYTVPLDLTRFDSLDWMTEDAGLDTVAGRLDVIRQFPLLTRAMVARLSPVDPRSFDAGFMGSDWNGLYDPARERPA